VSAAGHRTLARVSGVVLTIAAGAVTLGGVQDPRPARQWPPAVERVDAAAPVLSPADALRTFAMPPGYRLELVASEPLIQDPIAIDWDPAGRLWAIELPGYMRDIKATGEHDPIARIVVLEDATGDGTMDRRTVFTDGLIQPRAMKVLEEGVLVGEPPNVWLLRDLDGDLRSDRKELIASGYGRRETNVEVNANALLWGLDNRIHVAGTGADMVLRFSDRTFQVQKSLSRGQWGATQDDAGRVYRNHNESVLHVDLVPTPYFARNPSLLRTRGSHEAIQDPDGNINAVWPAHQTPGTNRAYQHGILRENGTLAGYTAACAPTVYRGDRLPAELYGNVFVAEPTANVVSRFVLSDDGTTLVAKKAYRDAEFISSTDERFRPVYLSNAPDGTLYVVDLYRGIIQHHAYITEYLRDQIASRALEKPTALGRIYRVVHDSTIRDRTTAVAAAASPPQIVALLSHPNGWWRDTAQRLLVERGDRSVAAALTRLLETTGDWRTRIHALWTLDGLIALTPAIVTKALSDPSRDVRASAARLAERWLSEADHPLQREVIALADDPDWAVRQHVAASIATLPPGRRESAIAGVLDKYGSDPIMTDVALSGVRGSERAVLGSLLQISERSSARESAITMLAATIIKSAQQDAIGELFASTAESGRAGWQRAALLRGAEVAILGAAMPGTRAPRSSSNTTMPCATCPGGRAGPGGAYAFPRPADWPGAPVRSNAPALRLLREPKALIDLAAGAGEFGARATAVLARVSWPGKAGDAAAPRALTAAEQQQFERGREVYRNICQGCHQPDGRGLERIAPSLIGSRFALANAEVPIRILINGKEGTTGLMPPVGGTLDDAQIAGVLTYVRREWGQAGDPVLEAMVGKVRAAAGARTRPWTDAELIVLLTAGSPR
jgi:mono/diheme cytochrome c family protein/glucose/arabinose dehydrogenase